MSDREPKGEWCTVDADGKRSDREVWEPALAQIDRDEFGIIWLNGLRMAISLGETYDEYVETYGEPPEAARKLLGL